MQEKYTVTEVKGYVDGYRKGDTLTEKELSSLRQRGSVIVYGFEGMNYEILIPAYSAHKSGGTINISCE